MTIEDNKALYRRYIEEGFNSGNPRCRTRRSPDYGTTTHRPGRPRVSRASGR